MRALQISDAKWMRCYKMPSHGNFPLFENVGIRIKQIYFEFTFTEALLKNAESWQFSFV